MKTKLRPKIPQPACDGLEATDPQPGDDHEATAPAAPTGAVLSGTDRIFHNGTRRIPPPLIVVDRRIENRSAEAAAAGEVQLPTNFKEALEVLKRVNSEPDRAPGKLARLKKITDHVGRIQQGSVPPMFKASDFLTTPSHCQAPAIERTRSILKNRIERTK